MPKVKSLFEPQCFEEYLMNAGWRGQDEDPESNIWVTRNMAKHYVSVRWYRRVRQKLERGCSDEDHKKILGGGGCPRWFDREPTALS